MPALILALWLFVQTRTVTREAIKVGFLDLDGHASATTSGSTDFVDLDAALDYTLAQVWRSGSYSSK
jgi:hypothetical protein